MNNSDKKLVYALIGLPAVIVAFLIGLFIGSDDGGVSGNDAATNGSYVDADEFAPFWTAWSVLDDKNINAASTSRESKLYGSIQGLASSYNDPYTVFFPPTESKLFQENIAGDFGGVGMEIGIKENKLTVVTPLKGSPAEAAGVKAGDVVLQVNGTSTQGMAVDQAVSYIRGVPGTKVTITFLPVGATKPVERTIVRDVIKIPTIDIIEKGDIYTIRLYSFTAQSADLFREALRKFVLSGKHKLILDLRGNPGGYLDAAWDMASWFLPAGKVVVTEDFGKPNMQQIFRSKGYKVFHKNLQMIILADAGSASASEILAGALREHGVAKIVGVKTFGKGSVQELVPITSNTSLKVTVAYWKTPLGHNLSKDGLEPDYKVEITEEDAKKQNDSQMNKAIELLNDLP